MKKNLKLKERLGAFFLALLFVLQAVLEPFCRWLQAVWCMRQ